MAKNNCPLCGGNVEIRTNKKGGRSWHCKKDGEDASCKGWGFYPREKKAGATEGKPEPETKIEAQPPKPTPAPKPEPGPAPIVERRKSGGGFFGFLDESLGNRRKS